MAAQVCNRCKAEKSETECCGLCLKPVCEDCAASQSVIVYSEEKQLKTACAFCAERLAAIELIITTEGLIWSRLSPRGRRWFVNSSAEALAQESKDSLSTYSTLPIEPEDSEMIQKDVYFGRTDPATFHWEYTEMILRVVEKAGPAELYRTSISNVLRAYCGRNTTVGYCQGLNFVTAWLLLFMDENSAFWMLTKLISSTLLPGFYSGAKTGNSLNGFYIEAGVVARLMDAPPGLSANDFSDFFCIQLLIQLFVGTVDIPTALYLWDKLTTEGVISI
jgi:hypothetical protein